MAGVRRALRVYADTSVFGGCFDEEFRTESVKFFEDVRSGRFILVISDVTLDELALAPEEVRQVLAGMPPSQVEVVGSSAESGELQQAYLDAEVVGAASRNDAAHIAVATVYGADLVVSWNFRHIVHFEKIAGYEGINSLRGYRGPKIYSPREVVTP
jgi:predicted nucleic acid-binding protein